MGISHNTASKGNEDKNKLSIKRRILLTAIAAGLAISIWAGLGDTKVAYADEYEGQGIEQTESNMGSRDIPAGAVDNTDTVEQAAVNDASGVNNLGNADATIANATSNVDTGKVITPPPHIPDGYSTANTGAEKSGGFPTAGVVGFAALAGTVLGGIKKLTKGRSSKSKE
jgi:hypothetical protein